MNVLLVSHSAELGGGERCLLDLAIGLAERQIPVLVLCPREGALTASLSERRIPFLVTEMRRPRRGLRQLLELLVMWLPTVRRLAGLMRARGITVVYNNTVDALYAPFAAREARIPCVWHVHEVRPDPAWTRWLFAGLIARFATRAVFNSAATLEAFAGRGKRPRTWSVVYNGVSIPDSVRTTGPADHEVVAGFAGDMRPHKRPRLFIEALAIARKQVPTLRGSVAGDGLLLESVRETAARLGLGDTVTFCGRVRNIGEFYSGLDLLVLTSEREGFGQVLVEAMAAGVPVVAAAVGGVPEAIEDGVSGYLVPSGDAAAFARRMVELASDADLRRRMGAAARRRVAERFTLSRYRAELIAVLETAAGRDRC